MFFDTNEKVVGLLYDVKDINNKMWQFCIVHQAKTITVLDSLIFTWNVKKNLLCKRSFKLLQILVNFSD